VRADIREGKQPLFVPAQVPSPLKRAAPIRKLRRKAQTILRLLRGRMAPGSTYPRSRPWRNSA
jgi:hypothetical protein